MKIYWFNLVKKKKMFSGHKKCCFGYIGTVIYISTFNKRAPVDFFCVVFPDYLALTRKSMNCNVDARRLEYVVGIVLTFSYNRTHNNKSHTKNAAIVGLHKPFWF